MWKTLALTFPEMSGLDKKDNFSNSGEDLSKGTTNRSKQTRENLREERFEKEHQTSRKSPEQPETWANSSKRD